MKIKRILSWVCALLPFAWAETGAAEVSVQDVSAVLSLKVPGNAAREYPLEFRKLQEGVYAYR